MAISTAHEPGDPMDSHPSNNPSTPPGLPIISERENRVQPLGSDSPPIILGSEATNTPLARGLFSDLPFPSSPTLHTRSAQFEYQKPQDETHRPHKRPRPVERDVGFRTKIFGTPASADEALNEAHRHISLALSLAKDQTQQKTIKDILDMFEDYVAGNPMKSTLANLHAALDKANKVAKNNIINNSHQASTHPKSNPQPKPANNNSTIPNGEISPLSSTPDSLSHQPSQENPWKTINKRGIQNSTHNTSRTTPPNTTKHHNKPNTRLILTKEKGKDFSSLNALTIRDLLNNKIGQPIISTVSLTKTGNLILTTNTGFTAEKLAESHQIIKQHLSFDKWIIDTIWYQVAVHGIPIRGANYDGTTYDFSSVESLGTIKKEITTFNSYLNLELQGEGVNWLTPFSKRNQQDTYKASIVVSVKTKEQQQKIIKKGLNILGLRVRAEPLHKASPTFQCNNCQGWGHYPEYCKNKTSCRICSEEHKTSLHKCQECPASGTTCPHSKIVCTNCNKDHLANSKLCDKRPANRPHSEPTL